MLTRTQLYIPASSNRRLPLVINPTDNPRVAARRTNAAKYNELFADVDEVVTPIIREYNESTYNYYVIRAPRRDECRQYLKDNNIGHEVYYPLSLHEQECFAELGCKRGDFPESEKAADETLALPIYPELTDGQIHYVVEIIKSFLRQ